MTHQKSRFPLAVQTNADSRRVEHNRHVYLKPREAWTLLRISKSTFYRLYYPTLSKHPTTVMRNGHYLFNRDTVLLLLRPVGTSVPTEPLEMKIVRPSKQVAVSQL